MAPAAVGAVWAKIIWTAVVMVASYVLMPKPKKFKAEAINTLQSAASSIAPWRVVYGDCRVGGTYVFSQISGGYTWYVLVLACHEVEGIGQLYFGADPIALDGIDEWYGGEGTGDYADAVWVWKHLGDPDQTYDVALGTALPTYWTSAHRLRGRAYVVIKLKNDPEIFPNGLPNISFRVKGKNDILDPRTDTYGWTDNPALIAADYIAWTHGLKSGAIVSDAYTAIDEDLLEDAADICEEAVTLDAGGSEDRYRLSGAIDLNRSKGSILSDILASMAGCAVWSEGVWKIYAGKWRDATVTITEDDLAGPVTMQPRLSRRELANTVKGVYISPAAGYLPTDYPVVTNATYVTQDGETIVREIDLPLVTSVTQCQRLAKIDLERGRQQITVELPVKLSLWALAPPDAVKLTLSRYGWTEKLFEVVSAELYDAEGESDPVIGIRLTLRETSSSVYTWSAEETLYDDAPDTTLLSPAIGAPTGLDVTIEDTVEVQDGINIPLLSASWTAPADAPHLSHYQVRHRDNAWTAGVYLYEGSVPAGQTSTSFAYPCTVGATWVVEIRSVSLSGQVSSWVTDSVTVTADGSIYDGLVDPSAYIINDAGEVQITRAMESGEAQDGDAVSFTRHLDNTPILTFVPNCKTIADSLSAPYALIIKSMDLNTQGFTMYAKFVQEEGTTTQRTASFTGDTAIKTQTPEAYDDKYTFQFDVVCPIKASVCEVRLWTRPSGGSWVLRGYYEYFGGLDGETFTDERKQVTVDGLGANAEFKIEFTDLYGGCTITRDPVDWYEATAPGTESATDVASQVIKWTAWEGA